MSVTLDLVSSSKGLLPPLLGAGLFLHTLCCPFWDTLSLGHYFLMSPESLLPGSVPVFLFPGLSKAHAVLSYNFWDTLSVFS